MKFVILVSAMPSQDHVKTFREVEVVTLNPKCYSVVESMLHCITGAIS